MGLDRVPRIEKHLSVMMLTATLGLEAAWMFLPVYFQNHIDSVFLIGVITALPTALSLMLDIPVGNLVQRMGEKTVIFTGLFVNILPGLFYMTGVPLVLVLGKLFEGLSETFVWDGGWAISMKNSGGAENESLSVFMLGSRLSAIIGPVIGGLLIAAYGFGLVFQFWIFTAVVALVFFAAYIGTGSRKGFVKAVENSVSRKTFLDDYHHLEEHWTAVKLPLVLILLNKAVISFFWLALPLMLGARGTDFVTMGLIFGAAAIPTGFQYFFGRYADGYGEVKLVTVSSILLLPVMLGLGVATDLVAVTGLFFTAKLLTAGIEPALRSFYDKNVPDELEGEMAGFMELFNDIGETAGPFIAGSLAAAVGLNMSFVVMGLVPLLIVGVGFRRL